MQMLKSTQHDRYDSVDIANETMFHSGNTTNLNNQTRLPLLRDVTTHRQCDQTNIDKETKNIIKKNIVDIRNDKELENYEIIEKIMEICKDGVLSKNEIRKEIAKVCTTRGLSGITNLGNTCFMNSALQVLSATKELLAYLVHDKSEVMNHLKCRIIDDMYLKHKNDMKKTSIEKKLIVEPKNIELYAKKTITYNLRILFKSMWENNYEYRPLKFKMAVDTEMEFFAGVQQHDSQEFFTALLDKIHENTKAEGNMTIFFDDELKILDDKINMLTENHEEALKSKNNEHAKKYLLNLHELYKLNTKNFLMIKATRSWEKIIKSSYSIINDIFSGLSMTTITCNECKLSNHRFERFDILTLNLPENLNINRQQYSLDELMQSYVDTEKLENSNKYTCGYCGDKKDASKQTVVYNCPNILVIMIKKYQNFNGRLIKTNTKITYNNRFDISPYVTNHVDAPNFYELYATIRHSGGYGSGHYVAYTKNPINNMWYMYDDGNVYNVTNDEVLQCNAYMLCYRMTNVSTTAEMHIID